MVREKIYKEILKTMFIIGMVCMVFVAWEKRHGIKCLCYDLIFYQLEHTDTELEIKSFAEEHRVFYKQYPQSLVELLERNPETEEFVLNYPLHQPQLLDMSNYSRDEVPLFMQWDSQWGYQYYGEDMIAITGCGPTCLAMAGYYLTGNSMFSPGWISRFAQENGYYVWGKGSAWSLIEEGGEKLGLEVEEIEIEKENLLELVENGIPVILVLGPGDFTTEGHFIVLKGSEGELFRVNDPNSHVRSQKLWSFEQLEHQIKRGWSVKLPG